MATGGDLRRLALAMEGVVVAPHFDRLAFKVARTFVTLAPDGLTANFKFTPDEQEFKCLLQPNAFHPIDNVWGRRGWTVGTLAELDLDGLESAIAMAYAHAVGRSKGRRRFT